MNWHILVRERLGDITGDAVRDAEIVEELAQHLTSKVDELRAAGASESEAVGRVLSEIQGMRRTGTGHSFRRSPASGGAGAARLARWTPAGRLFQ